MDPERFAFSWLKYLGLGALSDLAWPGAPSCFCGSGEGMGSRLCPKRSHGILEGTSVWDVAFEATSREGIERREGG